MAIDYYDKQGMVIDNMYSKVTYIIQIHIRQITKKMNAKEIQDVICAVQPCGLLYLW